MKKAFASARLLKTALVSMGKSRFFTVSLIIHSVIVVLLSGTVLVKSVVDDRPEISGFPGDTIEAPRLQQDETLSVTTPQVLPSADKIAAVRPAGSPADSVMQTLTTSNPSASHFVLPRFTQTAPAQTSIPTQPHVPPAPEGELSRVEAEAIHDLTKDWRTRGGGASSVGGPIKAGVFEFKAYLAEYSKGDWASTVVFERNGNSKQIVKGSLPNLLYAMRKWSGNRIKAEADPVPLRLDSSEIFVEKPPFIFFTGRRDFELTELEVANLRKYLMSGGAIWGDSSLPGKRSRFDIAFRREMKRVLPDRNRDWEPLPANHPLFSGDPRQVYFPEIREAPTGLNFYRQPIEVLKVHNQIAVLYSSNNYADQWQIGIDENGRYDTRRDATGRDYIAITNDLWEKRDFYFRNLDEAALLDSYKFGINVVTHFLIRWEAPLSRVPNM